MRQTRVIAPLVMLFVSVFSGISAVSADDEGPRLLRSSGIVEHYSALFDLTNSQMGLKLDNDKLAFYKSEYKNAALDALAGVAAADKRYLADWFESLLGQKLGDTYAHPSDYLAPSRMPEGLEQASDSRKQLIEALIESGAMVEASMNMNTELSQVFFMAMNTHADEEHRISAQDMAAYQQQFGDEARSFYRAILTLQMGIAFEHYNQDELLQLGGVFQERAYRAFSEATQEAFIEVLSLLIYEQGAVIFASYPKQKPAARRRASSCPAPVDHGISQENLLAQ